MLNANQTHCPMCNRDLRLSDVQLSRLPFDNLSDWLESNIMCKRCVDCCKAVGKWERIYIATNLDTGRAAFFADWRPGKKADLRGCWYCDEGHLGPYPSQLRPNLRKCSRGRRHWEVAT